MACDRFMPDHREYQYRTKPTSDFDEISVLDFLKKMYSS